MAMLVPRGTEIRVKAGGHYLTVLVAEQPGEFSFQGEGIRIYVLFGGLASGNLDDRPSNGVRCRR
jgi:hypothetical protein